VALVAEPESIDPPYLPELAAAELPAGGDLRELALSEALVERGNEEPIAAQRLSIEESRVDGLTLAAGRVAELRVRDAVLEDCDLSNVIAGSGELRRVQLANPRLVGLALGEGVIEDTRLVGGTLRLGSLAGATLRRVAFEDVDLREASLAEARLRSVSFERCALSGLDLRGARLEHCAIRGASLDGVIGIESLRGLSMPWNDLVASTGALAAALGIEVESEPS
jgi:uncharacterized protein YjbI with pentapeptide repeats